MQMVNLTGYHTKLLNKLCEAMSTNKIFDICGGASCLRNLTSYYGDRGITLEIKCPVLSS